MKTLHETTVPLSEMDWKILRRIKTAARLSLGFVWVWEGLMPKMLFPSPAQFEMVRRSGWWIGSPEHTLFWLGAAMIIAGLAIMSGLREKLAVAVATVSVLVLMVLVIATNPDALHDPFGGLAKDACLFVCAALVWWWPEKRRT
jgi:uncharacterized membrane protein YphA (DoxX/SURF4 family)